MGPSRTWRVPVLGRFTFRPFERPKVRGGAGSTRRSVPMGDKLGEEILTKDSCYRCGKVGRHTPGCPWA